GDPARNERRCTPRPCRVQARGGRDRAEGEAVVGQGDAAGPQAGLSPRRSRHLALGCAGAGRRVGLRRPARAATRHARRQTHRGSRTAGSAPRPLPAVRRCASGPLACARARPAALRRPDLTRPRRPRPPGARALGRPVTERDDFRAGVRAALEARLTPRRAGDALTVLGAGSDDLAAGRAYLRALADGGWPVPTWPAEHGGLGASPAQAAVVAQELGRFDVPDLYPYLIGLAIAGPTLVTQAQPDECSRWLPAISTG